MKTMKTPVVVLVGPPGAGKSTAGAKLAEALGTTFRDTDADIEAKAGKPIPDIFIEDGEAAFREREQTATRQALSEHDGVLALGSGAILDPQVQQELVRDHTVVYLAADFGTVAKHAGLDKPRVVLPGNPRGRLRAMLDERRPLYEAVATITIQADDYDPADLATEIAARLAIQNRPR